MLTGTSLQAFVPSPSLHSFTSLVCFPLHFCESGDSYTHTSIVQSPCLHLHLLENLWGNLEGNPLIVTTTKSHFSLSINCSTFNFLIILLVSSSLVTFQSVAFSARIPRVCQHLSISLVDCELLQVPVQRHLMRPACQLRSQGQQCRRFKKGDKKNRVEIRGLPPSEAIATLWAKSWFLFAIFYFLVGTESHVSFTMLLIKATDKQGTDPLYS